MFFVVITVPEISWIDRNVTIPEGTDRQLCFMSNIGTARPYDVSVAVRGKGDNPASGIVVFTLMTMSKRGRKGGRF